MTGALIGFVPVSTQNHAGTDKTVPLLLSARAQTHQISREKKAHGGTQTQDPSQTASTRTTDLATQPHGRPVTLWQRNKGSQSENFTICLGLLSPLVTSQVTTFVHSTSNSLCVGQSKYQRFRILGQSDCRAEGQAHFCDRLCLPPNPFHLNGFQDFSFSKRREQSRGITFILVLHTAIFIKTHESIRWQRCRPLHSLGCFCWFVDCLHVTLSRILLGLFPYFFEDADFLTVKTWSYRVLNSNNNIHTRVTIELR